MTRPFAIVICFLVAAVLVVAAQLTWIASRSGEERKAAAGRQAIARLTALPGICLHTGSPAVRHRVLAAPSLLFGDDPETLSYLPAAYVGRPPDLSGISERAEP